ncbi:hypothetical protein LshimejAT787_1700250 [Lyophyllum shimeji]|uniref:Uncharacterized protein n=1 Tax=Lyophyllum shimeji TaxID=47721 RepID=A0A9P3PYJ6_LYOSH|nr:hypothetical protein LshimejAT787_1700250 [Lyophyllum shimeji]
MIRITVRSDLASLLQRKSHIIEVLLAVHQPLVFVSLAVSVEGSAVHRLPRRYGWLVSEKVKQIIVEHPYSLRGFLVRLPSQLASVTQATTVVLPVRPRCPFVAVNDQRKFNDFGDRRDFSEGMNRVVRTNFDRLKYSSMSAIAIAVDNHAMHHFWNAGTLVTAPVLILALSRLEIVMIGLKFRSDQEKPEMLTQYRVERHREQSFVAPSFSHFAHTLLDIVKNVLSFTGLPGNLSYTTTEFTYISFLAFRHPPGLLANTLGCRPLESEPRVPHCAGYLARRNWAANWPT